MTHETLVAIVVAALTFVIGPVAVAVVNRQAKKAPRIDPVSGGDMAADEINRSTRTLGERLHDETRAVTRRGFSEVHERFDQADRRMIHLAEELREFLHPAAMRHPLEKLSEAHRKKEEGDD